MDRPEIEPVPEGAPTAPADTAVGERPELDQIFLSIAAVGQLTIGALPQRERLPRR